MEKSMCHENLKLPSLSQRIKRGFFIIIGINTLFGLLMILTIHFACQFTPKIMRNNYASIDAVSGMYAALRIIRHPEDNIDSNKPTSYWIQQFEKYLSEEDGSISEPGEEDVDHKIHAQWNKIKGELSHASIQEFNAIKNLLDDLKAINQAAMFETTERNRAFEKKVLLFGFLSLLVITLLTLFVSDSVAYRLSSPLRKITDIIHGNPHLGGGLSLPKSMTHEIDALSEELSRLWNHLSELKKLDVEALFREKKKLKTILASVEDAVLVTDSQNKVIHVNPGMLEILDTSIEKIQDQNWSNLNIESQNFNLLKNELMTVDAVDAVDAVDNFDIELIVNQQKRTFEIRSRKISTDKGAVGHVFLLHDVTEKTQRERLKREFIGVLSHELKTPVQSLSMAIELVNQEKEKMSPSRQRLLETMTEDLARVRAIANEFFQASLGEIRSLKINLETIRLEEMIHKWLKPFRVLASDRNIALDFVEENKTINYVKLDKSKFPWAVSNLLSNAIRVSPKSGSVRVSLSESENHVKLQIADDGPGIPVEIQNKVFKPYFQVAHDKIGSIDAGFLGIGLTVAKEVVTAHGGEITYYPNKPTGTIFEIQLPKATFEMERNV